jgi:tRNA G10  N-methylase Trm11
MLRSQKKSILEAVGRQPIHPFPARMAAGIALEALGEGRKKLVVLDPMSGSGTVLAVARANGHKALGVDLDPLAVLLTRVWTRPIKSAAVKKTAELLLLRAQKRFDKVPSRLAYPPGSDAETRKFIRFWFDADARRQLAALAHEIGAIDNARIRDALWCGFSRLIITKSAGASLAMDLSHSRPHKKFDKAPVKPFNKFLAAVETVASNCPQLDGSPVGPSSIVKCGDARSLSIKSGTVDLVITSPPYLNAIDYMRCSKFSLVWMGYTTAQIRKIRGVSVGAEAALATPENSEWISNVLKKLRVGKSLSARDKAILTRYAGDMEKALGEVARVLKRGGRAVYVVGNSTIKGAFVRNSTIVSEAANQHGLRIVASHTRTLPANRRYLPPPNAKQSGSLMDTRMRQEVVLVFKKTA